MADHTDITEKLNDGQRADLAADITKLSEDEYVSAGIPKVRFMAAEEALGGAYPSYKAMANSWNKELFRQVWQDAAVSCAGKAEVLVSPGAGTGVTPYSGCAAEDPCLAEGLMTGFASGVKKAGLTPCVSCGMPAVDMEYMDGAMHRRVLSEMYISAYGSLPEGTAYTFNAQEANGGYAKLLVNFLNDREGAPAIIVDSVPPAELKKYIENGVMVKGGSGEELSGQLTAEDQPLLEGAVQRAADFAFTVNEKGAPFTPETGKKEKRALSMAEQSCVLLKNDGTLPFKNGADIGVFGGLSDDVNAQTLCAVFKAEGRHMAEGKQGYRADGGIDPALTEEALLTAGHIKYAVVFLGFNEKSGRKSMAQRCTKLPAVQLALLDKLAASDVKIVAVVGADYPVDLSFDDKAAAIVVCPSTGGHTAEALFNVLAGKVSPSGRLAQTWYRDTDSCFRLLKNEVAAGARRTGLFTGYRDYVTSGEKQPYPFGFGLSYSSFEYSDLSIRKSEIQFRVKNTGRQAAGEVIQVYVGMEESAVARPYMQLKAFIRVFLKAGETTVCTVKCAPKTFEIFNGGKFITEEGLYKVYIGSSSRDIRLWGYIYSQGEFIDNKRPIKDIKDSWYYDTSQSNILGGGFTFGEVTAAGRFGKTPLKLGITLGIAVVLAMLALTALQIGGYINFAYMDWWAKFGIICVLSVTGAAIFFMLVGGIIYMASKNKKVVVSTGSSGAEVTDERKSYEQLFEELYGPEEYDEYDDGEEPVEEAEEKAAKAPAEKEAEPDTEEEPPEETHIEEPVEKEPVFVGKFDADVTYADLCNWLNDYMISKGIDIKTTGARRVLSAFASSRLIISGGVMRLTRIFANALSEYFTGVVYDCDLAYCTDDGIFTDSAFIGALQHAEDNPDDIVLITLRGADDSTAAYITPFIRCAYAKGRVTVTSGENSAVIPANVWFNILPSKEIFGFADKLLCRVPAVLITEINRCDARDSADYKKLNYWQFKTMNDKIIYYDDKYTYSLDEKTCWKKIDTLEKYLSGACGYVLDNRDILSMERYAAVYLACGGDQNDALDNVTAVKMLLPAMQALNAKGLSRDGFIAAIEADYVDANDLKMVVNYLR